MRMPDQAAERRAILKSIGAGSAVGLAGCLGGDGGGDGGDSGDGGGTTTGTSGGNGEWPDLSGKEVQFLTDEANEATQRVYEEIISEFEEATGGSVEIEYVPYSNFNQRVAQLLQANTPPELVLTTTSTTANYLERGVAEPATEVFGTLEEKYGSPPEGSRVSANGEEYLIPLWTNSGMNHYRSDVADVVPDTWEKELQYAQAADGQDGLAGVFVPKGQSVCVDQMMLGYAYANEARVCDRRDGEVTIVMSEGSNRDRWIETLEHFEQLNEFSPRAGDAGCGQMTQAVSREVSAQTYYIGARPKIQAVTQEKPFAADVHPVKTPSGRSDKHSGFVEGLQMFKGANKEAAEVFVQFLYRLDNFTKLALRTPIHNNPGWPGIRKSDAYQQGLKELPDAWSDRDIQNALDAIQGVRTLDQEVSPPNPYAGPIRASRNFAQMFFAVTIDGKDPASVVDSTANALGGVLEDARG